MKKTELVKAVSDVSRQTQSRTGLVLDALGAVVADALKSGQDVTLPGLGKLVPVHRAARKARNPRTGETLEMAAATVVKFRPATSLKELVK